MRSTLFLATLLFFAAINSFAQGIQITDPIRFLALGDSYTIGESVPETERWPVQFVEALKALGVTHQSTKIIATTGWRTDNLQTAIDQQNLQPNYNLVGLLIGVNNQYQHKPISQYYTEFEALLINAIQLAANDTNSVFVISIPDYAYTPYGQTANPTLISAELDLYNHINDSISTAYNVNYVYITDISRQGLTQPNLVANDGLHPSGVQYSKWVERLMTNVVLPTNLSSSNLSQKQHIKSIPNPVKDELKIQLDQILTGSVTTTITDTNGNLIATIEQPKTVQLTQIDLSSAIKTLPTGIYVIQLICNGKLFYSNRIIKE